MTLYSHPLTPYSLGGGVAICWSWGGSAWDNEIAMHILEQSCHTSSNVYLVFIRFASIAVNTDPARA